MARARSTTPNPAASATRIPRPAAPARSRSCAWGTWDRMGALSIRTSPSPEEPKPSKAARWSTIAPFCPSAAFSDTEIQERVPASETVRTTRLSLNLLGDGFVEAVADKSLIDMAHEQCTASHGKICGLAIHVPIVEAPGQAGIGRFG